MKRKIGILLMSLVIMTMLTGCNKEMRALGEELSKLDKCQVIHVQCKGTIEKIEINSWDEESQYFEKEKLQLDIKLVYDFNEETVWIKGAAELDSGLKQSIEGYIKEGVLYNKGEDGKMEAISDAPWYLLAEKEKREKIIQLAKLLSDTELTVPLKKENQTYTLSLDEKVISEAVTQLLKAAYNKKERVYSLVYPLLSESLQAEQKLKNPQVLYRSLDTYYKDGDLFNRYPYLLRAVFGGTNLVTQLTFTDSYKAEMRVNGSFTKEMGTKYDINMAIQFTEEIDIPNETTINQ